MKKCFLTLALLLPLVSRASGLPSANVQITPKTVRMGQTITADGTDSRTAAGEKYGLEMRCKFDLSEDWTAYSSGLKINYTPKKEGNFTAQCEVRDKENGGYSKISQGYQVRSNLNREAQIKVDKTDAMVGESIQFEIFPEKDVSEDLDKIWVRWDFESDGEWDTPFSIQKIKTHVYSLAGDYLPSAEVRFGGTNDTLENLIVKGLYSSTGMGVHISSARVLPPTVQVSPGKTGNTEETIFTFDANKSSLPAGGWIEWSFDGEPFDKKYIGKKRIRKKFASPGRHEVRTRMCIQRDEPICEETLTTVTVQKNPTDFLLEINGYNLINPTSFTYGSNVMNIFSGDQVRFTVLKRQGSASGTKFEYRWSISPLSSGGNGSWDTIYSPKISTEVAFNHVGEFLITVEGENEYGVFAKASRKIRVYPHPSIQLKIKTKSDTVFVNEWVTFSPQIKIENTGDSPPLSLSSFKSRVDADGDGIWDSEFRSGGSHRWKFETPGTYEVRMQVMDVWKKVRTIRKKIIVQSYQKPIAHVKVSNKYGTLDTRFEFDAQSSEGQNLSFFWKIGNGEFQKRGPRVFQRFSTVGKKWITLRIVNKDLVSDEIRFVVIVKKGSSKVVAQQTTNANAMKISTGLSLGTFVSPFQKKKQPNYYGDDFWGLPSRLH